MSKNILFVTRPTKDLYRVLILSCLTHIERLTKKKFTIQYFKNSFPDLKFLMFYFLIPERVLSRSIERLIPVTSGWHSHIHRKIHFSVYHFLISSSFPPSGPAMVCEHQRHLIQRSVTLYHISYAFLFLLF